MALTKIDDRGVTYPLDLLDSEKIRFGTGNDLELYHDGNSRVKHTGAGDLLVQTNSDFYVQRASDGHQMLIAKNDGAVELFFDNAKKFETTSTGITVSGDVKVGGNRFYSGAADEMDIYNNGTDSKIRSNGDPLKLEADSIILKANGNSDVALTTAINGAVELYHDNDLRFYTTTYGTILRGKEGYQAEVHIYGDEGDDNADKWQLHVGDAGFNILNYASGSWETNLECHGDGAVDLYYNNTKRLETTNNGAKLTAGNDSYGLWVDCNDTSYTSVVLNVECDRNTTDETYSHIGCHRSGAASVFFVRDSGNVENVNNSYGSTSDERLKENIVDAGSQWDDIKNLKVRKFNFKETTDPDKKTMIGLVAQEAEKVSPGLVSESKSMQGGVEGTYKTVKYSILYMKAIKALQEAITKIETLETKVAALEAE